MKILIISYFLPPVGTSHAYRWLKLARFFAEQGVDVDFYTSRSDLRDYSDFPFNIMEVGLTTHRQIEKTSKERKVRNGSNLSFCRKKILNKIAWIYRKIYWPDGLWYWLPFLLKELWVIKNNEYDLVISYSPTFSSHIGALFFKKVTSNKVKWLADYGDPFSVSTTMPPNNFCFYKKINEYIEAKVISNANKVSFTNKKTYDSYGEKFRCKNSCIIPHYVSVDDYYVIKDTSSQHVRYIGALHKNIREPGFVLRILDNIIDDCADRSKLNSLAFEFYGNRNGVDFFSRNVRYKGVLNKKDADFKVKSSCILINIENNNCVMSPSKIVEYLATGLPIMNFYNSDVNELFINAECTDSKWVLNITNETECEKIIEFINAAIPYQKDKEEVKKFLKDVDLDGVANRIMSWVRYG